MPDFIIELNPEEIKEIIVEYFINKYHPELKFFNSEIKYNFNRDDSDYYEKAFLEEFTGVSVKVSDLMWKKVLEYLKKGCKLVKTSRAEPAWSLIDRDGEEEDLRVYNNSVSALVGRGLVVITTEEEEYGLVGHLSKRGREE